MKLDRTGLSLFDRAVGKARRFVAQRSIYAEISIPADFRAISFCFDDFPASAVEEGAKTLEAHGLRGTFYTCFGTLGQDSPSGRLASQSDVRGLHRNGHEIGCHTFDHVNCAFIGPSEAAQSCALNRKVAAEQGIRLSHFAYPQGGIRAATKQLLAADYATARSSLRGLNRGVLDAHALRVVPIYDSFPASTFQAAVDAVARDGGWAIFYTHDIASAPSIYGTSKNRFRDLIAYTVGKNLPVLTVGEVYRLTGPAGAARSPVAAASA